MAHLSFHAGTEGKLKRTQIKGAIGHTFRASENRYKEHGNKDIDKSRTKYNLDWTRTGEPLDKLVESRLEKEFKGKRALRKDAVVIREVIAQASPEIYEGLTDEEKQKKAEQFTVDSLGWFRKEFGEQNVVGFSVHLDETNPHSHFAVMPMTKDGRVSQKDFFRGPNDLKRQHREYRQHMIDLGWDFEKENKYVDAEKVSTEVYKRIAPELEAKRAEHKRIMEDMARERMSDDAIEDLAVNLLLDEDGHRMREKLEVERAEVEQSREQNERWSQELSGRELSMIQREKEMREREEELKRQAEAQRVENERVGERSEGVRAREQEVALKERRVAKMDAVARASSLAVLKGDGKWEKAYAVIEKEGFDRFKPDGLQRILTDSIHRLNTGQRRATMGNATFVNQQVARMDAEQDDGLEM